MSQNTHNLTNITDVASAALWFGVLTDVVPVVLGLLGILWFVIRFVNLIRVNVLGKESWRGMG